MIRLNTINLDLPGFSLSDINLHVRKNDFFSLIGPTGSGKSLLLEGISGLIPFSDGQVLLDGTDITALPVEKRSLALVYQDFALFPHLNVTQNILYGVAYHKIPKAVAQNRFDRLVSTMGLEKIIRRQPQNLSGGEKQRVALARSLVLNPSVLLLDEPLSALDPIFHEEVKFLLKRIHKELEITIIMVSHNFPDVIYLANRGAIISNGRIVQQGEIVSIFERPNCRFAANFVGMKNINPIQHTGHQLTINDSRIVISASHTPEPSHTHMGIRPEDISLCSLQSSPLKNRFTGTIKGITSHGVFLNVSIRTNSGLDFEAIWPRSYTRDQGIFVGQTIDFGFRARTVHTF